MRLRKNTLSENFFFLFYLVNVELQKKRIAENEQIGIICGNFNKGKIGSAVILMVNNY